MSTYGTLITWLKDNGGGFHPNVAFQQDASGSRIVALEDLPKDTTVVTCPFRLVITKEFAKTVVEKRLGVDPVKAEDDGWTERQWLSVYLVLHSAPGVKDDKSLAHHAYLDTLPTQSQLTTPLHFTEEEIDIFRGTNLYNAILERKQTWKSEWKACRRVVESSGRHELAQSFTWDAYLTAATYVSSRAFPSSLLSPSPTLKPSAPAGPILIPGLDSLNHARGQAVTWTSLYPRSDDVSSPTEPTLSLVLHNPHSKGQELFNNYGPRSNAELILGYGFSLPNNPDDTMVLKIGGIQGQRWEVGRDAQNVEGVWNEVLNSVRADPDTDPTYEDLLDASGAFQEMLEALISRLPDSGAGNRPNIRPHVRAMFNHYLEGLSSTPRKIVQAIQHSLIGQNAIGQSLIEFAQKQEQLAIDLAKEQGIDLVMED